MTVTDPLRRGRCRMKAVRDIAKGLAIGTAAVTLVGLAYALGAALLGFWVYIAPEIIKGKR